MICYNVLYNEGINLSVLINIIYLSNLGYFLIFTPLIMTQYPSTFPEKNNPSFLS
jgi:hypothetical protein